MSVDLSPEEFQKLGVTAIANIAEQLLSFREPGSVRMPVPADLKSRILGQLLPEDGVDPDQLLQRVHDDLFPYPMGNAHPRFFAWVNSPPAPFGILGDLLASALNPSVAGGDHAATYVEHVVLRWLKEMLSYPVQAGAVLTSGGSAANLVCLGAMRHVMTEGRVRADGMDQSVNPLVVYVSEQGHSCIRKALEILGFGSRHIRTISCDDEFRFDVSALRKSIVSDVEAGLRPVCVAASAGTVNTGAIDPLDQIADLCQEFGLWFHIDGAYGAVGQLDTRLAELYTGLKRADSLAVDPHKWLYIPVDCGCALVADSEKMREAFSMVPEYLRDDTETPWFSEYSIEQTRAFRALKLWLVLQQVGLREYRRLITRDITLNKSLQSMVRSRSDFTLLSEGPLSVTCFQYSPPGVADVQQLNERLLHQVQRQGRVFLTSTRLSGEYVLRACIVNFRTREEDLVELLDTIESVGKGLITN